MIRKMCSQKTLSQFEGRGFRGQNQEITFLTKVDDSPSKIVWFNKCLLFCHVNYRPRYTLAHFRYTGFQ